MYSLQASKQHGIVPRSSVGGTADSEIEAGGVPFVVGDPRRHDERHRGWEKAQTVHPTLSDTNPQTVAFANTAGDTALGMSKPGAPPITTRHGDPGNVLRPGTIPRRLTPRECERLQGFPDDWTRYTHDGTELADSPRYRMLGNAVTVSVAHWIGRRLLTEQRAGPDPDE